MERVTKLLLFLITALFVVFGSDVEGARTIKSNEKADQPRTSLGGTGSTFPRLPPTPGSRGSFPTPGFSRSFPTNFPRLPPTPGFSGSFPTPGFSGSFPTPGFSGSFPTPGFSGSFPTPSGSFPTPGFDSSTPSFGFGPPGSGSFCAFFPGTAGCAPARPRVSGGPVDSASP